ncbi:MAG: hypothetical protein A2087_07445 [Spirochaetes bacterium GWD1_61_31]|nr:MAG: hypothetical protein A2087_07445 [Spirochaetes bacterium GWD1_61_31]
MLDGTYTGNLGTFDIELVVLRNCLFLKRADIGNSIFEGAIFPFELENYNASSGSIDLTIQDGSLVYGIYSLEGSIFRFEFAAPGEARPTEFSSEAYVLTRQP